MTEQQIREDERRLIVEFLKQRINPYEWKLEDDPMEVVKSIIADIEFWTDVDHAAISVGVIDP